MHGHSMRDRSPRAVSGWPVIAFAVAAVGCTVLDPIELKDKDPIVTEAWAVLVEDGDGSPVLDAFAFLQSVRESTTGADVRISNADGRWITVAEQEDHSACLDGLVPTGVCYRTRLSPSPFAPGDRLELNIEASGGRRLSASSRMPGGFSLLHFEDPSQPCRLEPETNYRLEWTLAEGAWSYFTDTRIKELPVPGEDGGDSVYLRGTSLGSQDTSIVFPRRFGIYSYLMNDNRSLILSLQNGLPEGARARIAIAAADPNWTNWSRGEVFDPT